MRRAGKGYAIENNIRNKNPQWMVVEPKQPLFNDNYYADKGGQHLIQILTLQASPLVWMILVTLF